MTPLPQLPPRNPHHPVLPEARPLRIGQGSIGVLMSHGFTGTVASVAPWARGIAESAEGWPGARVIAPRLPGHGTHWHDLARTRWWDWYWELEDAYHELATACDEVFVAGLSMGGALALLIASREPVAGVLLVNPAVATRDRRIPAAAALHRVLPSQPGIASDIALEGVVEPGYDRFSVTTLKTMTDLWRVTREALPRVTAPVLLMRSASDHVVDDLSGEVILRHVATVREVSLPDSYHVATLDHDAHRIIDESRAFIAARA